MLKLDSVAKNYGGIAAVRDCSYEVQPVRITGLIGPNGAGKTTTFNLISGAERLNAGEIYFDGARITGLPPHQIARRGLVRTFQIPRELNDVLVIESLKMAPINDEFERIWSPYFHFRKMARMEQELEARALEVLDLVSLRAKAGAEVRTLSGGQRKLLELARAVMFGPRMVLLDEPTAGVNPAIIEQILDVMRTLKRRGITAFIVEHNMEFVRQISDHVIVMAEGTPLTEGSFEQISAHQRVAEAYLGRSS